MIPKMDEHRSMSKWDLLHMESKKNLSKRDLTEDEIRLMKEQEEYTFQPNSRRRATSPNLHNRSQASMNSSFQRPQTNGTSSKKKMFTKPPLDQGRKRLSSVSPGKRPSSRFSQGTNDDRAD